MIFICIFMHLFFFFPFVIWNRWSGLETGGKGVEVNVKVKEKNQTNKRRMKCHAQKMRVKQAGIT